MPPPPAPMRQSRHQLNNSSQWRVFNRVTQNRPKQIKLCSFLVSNIYNMIIGNFLLIKFALFWG